jgi:hypothetical protein
MTARLHACLLLVGLVGACRPGAGDPCVCEGDCKRGLVCAYGGRILGVGECVVSTAPDRVGECVEAEDVPDDADDLPPPPLYYDLGSRRDFDSGQPPSETSTDTGDATGDATEGTGTTGTTETGTGTTVGTTDTGDATETGTGTESGDGA